MMNTIPMILALAAVAGVALVNANRAGRAEAALRRVVEAQALAMWANTSAEQEVYERLANDRDDAIDAAAVIVPRR